MSHYRNLYHNIITKAHHNESNAPDKSSKKPRNVTEESQEGLKVEEFQSQFGNLQWQNQYQKFLLN